MRDAAQVERLAAAAIAFGDGRIDILVNNAGGLVRRAPFAEVTPALLDETLRLNFVSAAVACHEIVPGMAERGYGRVVNVGSVAAHTGNPTNHHYAAAKAALTSLGALAHEGVRRARRDHQHDRARPDRQRLPRRAHAAARVRGDASKTIPAGRAGTNQDVAAAVAFLVSDAAGYVSGDDLHVNGGLYVS